MYYNTPLKYLSECWVFRPVFIENDRVGNCREVARKNKMVMKPCQEPSRYCVASRDILVETPWSVSLSSALLHARGYNCGYICEYIHLFRCTAAAITWYHLYDKQRIAYLQLPLDLPCAQINYSFTIFRETDKMKNLMPNGFFSQIIKINEKWRNLNTLEMWITSVTEFEAGKCCCRLRHFLNLNWCKASL